jgi:O-glycosyl hydrolase
MTVKRFQNRQRGAYAALFIGLVLHAGPAAAQNLITNPGFETGDASGWAGWGSATISAETAQIHTGSFACLVTNRTANWNGIVQSFLGVLQSGQTYNVSAWVRVVSGTNQNMQLTMQKTDGSGTGYSSTPATSVSSTNWTQLSGQYTYNPSGSVTSLNFYAEMPTSTSVAFYIDDVVFSAVGTGGTNPVITAVSTVDWNSVYQRIDGFGASSAWDGTWTTAQADLIFSTNNNVTYSGGVYNGVGLSLLRNHITFASTTSASDAATTGESSIMQMAQARGAKVWSTPWTPAAGFKSPNNIYNSDTATGNGINGGSYLGDGNNITNVNYASQLANYVAQTKTNYGVNLYALSVQNEPDANVTNYEACQWTGAQIRDFVTNLSSALAAKGFSSTKIIVGESQNWTDPKGFASTTMSDPNAAAEVGIIANHNYVPNNDVGDQTVPAAIASYGKGLWETEVSLLSGSDSSIANGVYYAKRVHLFMTRAQANAYHYWWVKASGNQGLLDTSSFPTKRLFTVGQYSRFVRPNFYRIDASSSQPSAWISAYKDSTSTAFAIVVINTNAALDIVQTFNLSHFTAGTVTPWVTSGTLSLSPQTAITLTNSSFTYLVPAMSVVTFVGRGNTPPGIAPVSDQTVNPGVMLLVTNTASDSDLPAQTLSFSAANPMPANATINSSSGVFSWRPMVSQAGTTNLIQIQVTDSGVPSLSATNSFHVMVNSIASPVVSSIAINGGEIDMLVNGPTGPDYTLLTSSNLLDWQSLFTLSSPTPPVTLTDTNPPDGATRFYRIQLGP